MTTVHPSCVFTYVWKYAYDLEPYILCIYKLSNNRLGSATFGAVIESKAPYFFEPYIIKID